MVDYESRTYEQERAYLERLTPTCWRIKQGFVPNMKVTLSFFSPSPLSFLLAPLAPHTLSLNPHIHTHSIQPIYCSTTAVERNDRITSSLILSLSLSLFQVEGRFYVNRHLEELMMEELEQYASARGVGGFLPAVKQIANVAALPGIVGVRFASQA